MEIIDYLLARKKAGGGSDVTIEQLNATENGTYSEEGIAYSPVVVDVPAPANSYQLKDVPSGAVSTIDDGTALPMPSLKVDIEPVQDLHGYDHPWAEGAGNNKLNPNSIKETISAISGSSEGSDADGNYVIIPRNASINNVILYSDFTENTQYTIFFKVKPTGETRTNIRVYYTDDTSYNIASSGDGVLEDSVYVTNASKSVSRIELGFWYLVTTKVYYDSWGIMQGSHTKSEFEPYSNICPISGWTAANVARTEVNQLDESTGHTDNNYRYFNVPLGENNLLYMSLTDKDTSVNVSDCSVGFTDIDGNGERSYRWILQNGTVNINHFNKAAIGIVEKLCKFIFVYPNTEEAWNRINQRFYVSVNYPSTDTEYHAYNGQTYTIEFKDGDNPLTVYGGTLDVTSGVLTVTNRELLLTDLTWSYRIINNAQRICSNAIDSIKTPQNDYTFPSIISSCYVASEVANLGISDARISIGPSQYSYGRMLIINDSRITSIDDILTLLNGQTIVYKLAEPITYQLTPAQVRTLAGTNNIWADTGDIIEGSYFKSLT